MLICTRYWTELGQKDSSYMIYDTDDHKSEEYKVEDIRWAFDNGYKIYGLLNIRGNICVDQDLMWKHEYFQWTGQFNARFFMWMLGITEFGGCVCIACKDESPATFRWRIFMNDQLIADMTNVPRAVEGAPVGIWSLYTTVNGGKPLTAVVFSHDKKDDMGVAQNDQVLLGRLQWGSSDVVEIKSIPSRCCFHQWWKLPSVGNQFTWCNREITLK